MPKVERQPARTCPRCLGYLLPLGHRLGYVSVSLLNHFFLGRVGGEKN